MSLGDILVFVAGFLVILSALVRIEEGGTGEGTGKEDGDERVGVLYGSILLLLWENVGVSDFRSGLEEDGGDDPTSISVNFEKSDFSI